jgi:translation elongation factor P/translation initiation factor 5A
MVRAAQVSSNDFKTGMTIEMDGAPYKVVGERQVVVAAQRSGRFS